jgi:hypothetical protein
LAVSVLAVLAVVINVPPPTDVDIVKVVVDGIDVM